MNWSVCVGTVLLCGCGAAAVDVLAPPSLGSPLGGVTLVHEAKEKAEGGYDLFRPMRVAAVRDAVWVLETGNDQLVRFDSTLTRGTAFGREGEGPGEIQFAMDFTVVGDRILIAESGNGRISTFDTTGAFVATLPTAESPRFLADQAGRLVVTLDLSPHYAYRVDEGGRLTPHASVPGAVRRLAGSDPATYLPAGPYITATPRGELVALDESVLAISVFDRDGRLVRAGLVPEPYRSLLLQRRLAAHRAFGARAAAFIDTPATKRISATPDGRVLVLFSLDDAWGLLVDPGSWSARPLVLPENRRLHDILWSAADAALSGDRLYVLSGGQLYQFAVEGW